MLDEARTRFNSERAYSSQELLQFALDIRHRLGWSVIPVRGKTPIVKWKRFQHRKPSEADTCSHFRYHATRGLPATGIAVVFGPVSGRLAARDFDDVEGYEEWSITHPDLASTLPTFRTARGYVVLFRADRSERIVNDEWADGIHKGELRAERVYSLLPPSLHPDGPTYRWLTEEPLRPADVPWLRLSRSGLLPASPPRHHQRHPNNNPPQKGATHQSMRGNCHDVEKTVILKDRSGGKWELIRDAILRSLPRGHGQRHHCILGLTMRLRDIEWFGDANRDFFRGVFDSWWVLARPFVRTQDPEVSFREFSAAWKKVPHGIWGGKTGTAVAERLSAPLPECPIYQYRQHEPTRRLLAVCDALQAVAKGRGEEKFFLSCRDAERICGFNDHKEAARRLKLFVATGLLLQDAEDEAEYGTDRRIASSYRLAEKGDHE